MLEFKISFLLFVNIHFMFIESRNTKENLSSSGSVLDIINTKKVEAILAERKNNTIENDIETNNLYTEENPEDILLINNLESPMSPSIVEFPKYHPHFNELWQNKSLPKKFKNFERQDNKEQIQILASLLGTPSMLKSTQDSVIITKKDYLRKDWCKTEHLVQRIHEEGCITRNIMNRFCYGQCNSFYIPKTPKKKRYRKRKLSKYMQKELEKESEDIDFNGAAFRSCAFCKPKKFTWITITLKCPTKNPQIRKRRIQRIKQCKCIAETVN